MSFGVDLSGDLLLESVNGSFSPYLSDLFRRFRSSRKGRNLGDANTNTKEAFFLAARRRLSQKHRDNSRN